MLRTHMLWAEEVKWHRSGVYLRVLWKNSERQYPRWPQSQLAKKDQSIFVLVFFSSCSSYLYVFSPYLFIVNVCFSLLHRLWRYCLFKPLTDCFICWTEFYVMKLLEGLLNLWWLYLDLPDFCCELFFLTVILLVSCSLKWAPCC